MYNVTLQACYSCTADLSTNKSYFSPEVTRVRFILSDHSTVNTTTIIVNYYCTPSRH